MTSHHFPFETTVQMKDLGLFRKARWEDIDKKTSQLIGENCFGIPSVRVGLAWALEYSNLNRHRDHILVPKFLGRCITNALNRYALPVEKPTSETKAVLIVDQYGLKHDIRAIKEELKDKNCLFLEDSPYGLGESEKPDEGSLARFIGFAKSLPVAQGALAISHDKGFIDFIKKKRNEKSAWSWLVWFVISFVRSRKSVTNQSAAAGMVYELYLESGGGAPWLRKNLLQALGQFEEISRTYKRRFDLLLDRLSKQILMPDYRRLGFLVPLLVNEQKEKLADFFRKNRFDETVYHVDTNRNLLHPSYQKAFMIPLNPRIPEKKFESFIQGIKHFY